MIPHAEKDTGALVEPILSEPVAIGRALLLKSALAGRACRDFRFGAGVVNYMRAHTLRPRKEESSQ